MNNFTIERDLHHRHDQFLAIAIIGKLGIGKNHLAIKMAQHLFKCHRIVMLQSDFPAVPDVIQLSSIDEIHDNDAVILNDIPVLTTFITTQNIDLINLLQYRNIKLFLITQTPRELGNYIDMIIDIRHSLIDLKF